MISLRKLLNNRLIRKSIFDKHPYKQTVCRKTTHRDTLPETKLSIYTNQFLFIKEY